MCEQKLKAYKVSCRDDDHGAVIRFARSSRDVDRYANSETCDCEFIDRTIRRAKEFDELAPGPLTPKDYLERGWYWGCSGCHEEMIHIDDNPLFVEGRVFCSIECVRKVLETWQSVIDSGKAHESVVAIWTIATNYLKSVDDRAAVLGE